MGEQIALWSWLAAHMEQIVLQEYRPGGRTDYSKTALYRLVIHTSAPVLELTLNPAPAVSLRFPRGLWASWLTQGLIVTPRGLTGASDALAFAEVHFQRSNPLPGQAGGTACINHGLN